MAHPNFPTGLPALKDDYADGVTGDDCMAVDQNDSAKELNAVAAKVGIDSSADTASHDYKIAALEDGANIHAATADTPLDADEWGFYDAVDAVLKKITWANIKATLKTWLITDSTNIIRDSMLYQSLINGNFDIWQRATTFTTPNSDTYIADRWNVITNDNGSWTFSRSTDTPTTKSAYSLKCANVTANKQMLIAQFIENVDALKLKGGKVSLSFQAKTTTGKEIANLRATVLAWNSTVDAVTSAVVAAWAGGGTDPTWATNWTAEKAGANKALTTSWQTFTIEDINLDTASTANLAVVIWVDDATITAGDEFYITQIQLNAGDVALPFQSASYQDELKRCQRYYQTGYTSYGSGATSGNTYRAQWIFPVIFRASPTITGVNGANQGFSTTVGSFSYRADGSLIEARTSDSSNETAYFQTVITADAEL